VSANLIEPHGGELIDLMVYGAAADEIKSHSLEYASWDLTPRQMNDLELLLTGAFSPLRGFLNRADYESVCDNMRLTDGTLWPMPVTLDVTAEVAESLSTGDRLALRDPEGVMLAVLTVGDVWEPDLEAEAKKVFNSSSLEHPAVNYLMNIGNKHYVGGTLQGVQLPYHYDFQSLRRTPAEMRAEFVEKGWDKLVAFQTRNPMHRAHVELTTRAADRGAGAVAVGDANGRPPRSGVARHHPQEPRCDPLHRRPRPRRSRQ
jgi:sulfate adenylyltransferase